VKLSLNINMEDLAQAVCAKDDATIMEFIQRIDEIQADSAFTRELRDHFALVVEQDKKDVHTEHCCAEHGCKYGENACTVKSGDKKQSFPCEICDDEKEEEK
jgi:hypothetical protein